MKTETEVAKVFLQKIFEFTVTRFSQYQSRNEVTKQQQYLIHDSKN
jgi:hypothetical protein